MRARFIAAATLGLTVVAGPAIAFASAGTQSTPVPSPTHQLPAEPVQRPAEPVQRPAEGDEADPANTTQLPAQPVPGL
ncbi:hypothetical protein GCM10010185_53850 [Saccharothrix coeruleofusca]|uniref:Uncharacterized protein n=1 Tax=Saccharothrix coeruleofusca TaxID=33919 RepID=A0A918AQL1_9PSEU|nr:hypothetical protein GCM10010185_53850 [Saccharothrix coeruleofusca]